MTSILFGIVTICSSLLKCNYLKNKKHFLKFLFCLWNLHQIFNIFKQKIIVIANLFPRLQTAKAWVDHHKKGHFRTSIGIQESQTLVKSVSEHFYHIFWSLCVEMICKISTLLNFEILGVFVDTLTPDDKYPVRYCENLLFPIQMELP